MIQDLSKNLQKELKISDGKFKVDVEKRINLKSFTMMQKLDIWNIILSKRMIRNIKKEYMWIGKETTKESIELRQEDEISRN